LMIKGTFVVVDVDALVFVVIVFNRCCKS